MQLATVRSDPASATVREDEAQRQLRLLGLIIPLFLTLALVALATVCALGVFLPVTAAQGNGLTIIGFGAALRVGLLWSARRALRRKQATVAILVVASEGILSALVVELALLSVGTLDAFGLLALIPLFAVIVLVGILADRRILLGITSIINVLTLGVILLAPQFPAISLRYLLGDGGILCFQWIFAGMMVIVQRRFQQLMREVDLAYERSRQLDSLKDAFISSVNHEIRTPLTSMVMYIETLKRQHGQMPHEQLQFGLERASDIGQSLTELVKSILSTRQVEHEATDLALEALPLLRLVNQTLTLLDPKEGGPVARDLRLHVSPMVAVWADRVKLQQVLLNLLSNALKYSEPGTAVEIKASYVTIETPAPIRGGRTRLTTQEQVEIAIRDEGHGIAPDQLSLLFQKFVRLPADLASKVTGNGLGLYLCRILVEAMGGSIWAESAGEGQGSTFFCRLPVPPPEFDALRNETVARPARV